MSLACAVDELLTLTVLRERSIRVALLACGVRCGVRGRAGTSSRLDLLEILVAARVSRCLREHGRLEAAC
jgi:hypothetical protein